MPKFAPSLSFVNFVFFVANSAAKLRLIETIDFDIPVFGALAGLLLRA